MKIAVVGAGVAGISAAWHLDQDGLEVHLIESGLRIGGHAHTQLLPVQEGSVKVDTGFSVCNPVGYPGFCEWLERLGVERRAARMDVSVRDQIEKLEFGTASLAAITGSTRQLFKPGYLRIWKERNRLFSDLQSAQETSRSLGDYLQDKRYSRLFVHSYLLPAITAFRPQTESARLDMPLTDAMNLLRDQKLLHYRGGKGWQRVSGGSTSYLRAFEKQFSGVIHTNSVVSDIRRDQRAVQLFRDGSAETYDALVLACDADQAIRMLADPNPDERTLLARAAPAHSDVFLHGDHCFMPQNPTCWASRNVTRERNGHHTVTYWINRIQGLTCSEQFFVTVNPTFEPQRVRWQGSFIHPRAGQSAQALQQRWVEVAKQGTYLAGGYTGYGTQEDGFISGRRCAEQLLHLAASHADRAGKASAA